MYQNPAGASAAGINAAKLSGKEKLKRIRGMQEFKESCELAFQNYEAALKAKSSNRADLEEPEFQASESDRLMSTKALKQQQKSMLNHQEEQLDEIYGVTKAIKYEGQNID